MATKSGIGRVVLLLLSAAGGFASYALPPERYPVLRGLAGAASILCLVAAGVLFIRTRARQHQPETADEIPLHPWHRLDKDGQLILGLDGLRDNEPYRCKLQLLGDPFWTHTVEYGAPAHPMFRYPEHFETNLTKPPPGDYDVRWVGSDQDYGGWGPPPEREYARDLFHFTGKRFKRVRP